MNNKEMKEFFTEEFVKEILRDEHPDDIEVVDEIVEYGMVFTIVKYFETNEFFKFSSHKNVVKVQPVNVQSIEWRSI